MNEIEFQEFKRIVDDAYHEWWKQIDVPDARTLTGITQQRLDEAYLRGDLPVQVMVSRADTPCGHTLLRYEFGEKVLFMEIKLNCSKKDCPNSDNCRAGDEKCLIYKFKQKV